MSKDKSRSPHTWVLTALLCSCLYTVTSGLAVMSVDLGSEYMKVAIVKPGVPMEVALNFESRRKTPVIVSMRNGERLFSDPALSTSVKYPDKAFVYLQDLLAKSLDNPVVQQYQERFPYHTIVDDPESNSIAFKYDDETSFTPEELLAMVFQHAKDIAENFAEQSINEAVITVPPYFNQAERRAMVRAGELAGLKVLQLMNDNTAVALNYGVFRRKSFNATAQHYMFFDMGASSASATVVSYQEVKEKNKVTGIQDKFPQVTVKGVGFDRNLGGLEIQLRLRDHLAKLFNEQKKTTSDVTQNKRSMGKLFKEAGRLKQVLSANSEHHAQVESLLDDIDFKAKVSRAELEEMCADIFERIGDVVKEALASSEVTMDEINEVILMGGSTRVPKVQEKLQKAIGRQELGKSINTDEASALGAVYQAAYLGKGFKVKKFGVKEANLFPIQVEFERVKTDENGEEERKTVRRTLFQRNNPYPQKKVMTFNKHVDDFTFKVNYNDLGFLSEEFLNTFGETVLQQISVSGVGEAYGKHHEEAENKGVKAHFKMDESGILVMDNVEFVFEKTEANAAVDSGADEESTLSKLGNTISNLFGGGGSEDKDETIEESTHEDASENKEEKQETEETEEEKPETEPTEEEKSETGEESGEKTAETEEKKEEVPETQETEDEKTSEQKETADEEESEKESEEAKGPETAEEKTAETSEDKEPSEKEGEKAAEGEGKTDESKEGEEKSDKKEKKKEKKDDKPKVVTIKEALKSAVKSMDVTDPTKEAIKKFKKTLKDLRKKDEDKKRLEMAMNELESYIIDVQDKLWQEEYESCSTESEREELRAAFSAAGDWMYDYDGEQVAKPYEDKLKELKKLTKDLWERVKEKTERPKAIEALNHILNYSTHFLIGMQNFTGEEKGEQPFTTVEYTTLQDLIKETLEWNKTMSADQEATPLTETPKLLVHDLALKINALDREIKYLTNKIKSFKPKPPKKEKEATNKTESANKTESKSKDKSEEGEQIEEPPVEEPAEGEAEQTEQPEVRADDTVAVEDTPQLDTPDEKDSADTTHDEQTDETATADSTDDKDSATHLPGEL